mgnify:FL=1
MGVRRWPAEANAAITASLPAGSDVPGASKAFRATPGQAIPVRSATLRIDGEDLATAEVTPSDTEAVFTAELAAGSHTLAPVFTTDDGQEIGCYFCDLQLVAE